MRSIYFAMDHILSIADFNQPDLHKHWAKHIVVSLDNQIEVVVGKNKIICDGIIINSNVIHTIYCVSQRHLVLTFEEVSNIASEIDRKYLLESDFCLLKKAVVDGIKQEFRLNSLSNNNVEYYKDYNKLLDLLGIQRNEFIISDKRILKILDMLKTKEKIDNNIIKEMLDLVNISQSRLSHLFKKHVGLSLNSYLVMMKLKKAYIYLYAGNNITNAALMAGFDSASHFAATSKDMIGFSAKNISRGCDFVVI